MTRVLFRRRGGGFPRHLAREIADQPRHAVRLHGRQQRIEPPRRQRRHFIERAGRQHGVEARIDARVKGCPIGREKDFCNRAGDQRRRGVLLPIRNSAAGRDDDFERPRDADPVGGVEPRRGGGIAGGKFRMERFRPGGFEPCPHRAANVRRHRRDRRQTLASAP